VTVRLCTPFFFVASTARRSKAFSEGEVRRGGKGEDGSK